MKRIQIKSGSPERKPTKKGPEPSYSYLHARLRRLGLPVTGAKKTMLERLSLYSKPKSELKEELLNLCPGVQIPRELTKKDMVVIIPKIREYSVLDMTLMRTKLERMTRYIDKIPPENASKERCVYAYVTGLINKTVGAHQGESEEEPEEVRYSKKDMLKDLNKIDSKIHFQPTMSKTDLVKAYHKYILEPQSKTKQEIRSIIMQKYPDHIPMSHANKHAHIVTLCKCMFHEEFGGEITDDPKNLHVEDLQDRLRKVGIPIHPGLYRRDLEVIYNVFVYKDSAQMKKRDIRKFLHDNGVVHHLTEDDSKKAHVKAYEDFFIEKYKLEVEKEKEK